MSLLYMKCLRVFLLAVRIHCHNGFLPMDLYPDNLSPDSVGLFNEVHRLFFIKRYYLWKNTELHEYLHKQHVGW